MPLASPRIVLYSLGTMLGISGRRKPPWRVPYLSAMGSPGAFIAAQFRFGVSVGWEEKDAPRIAAVLSTLSRRVGLPILFVPCMIGRSRDDRYAARTIQAYLDVQGSVLEDVLDAQTTKAILGEAAVGIGTANHFCVFTASMGRPAVGLYASRYMQQKLAGLAELHPREIRILSKRDSLHSDVLTDVAQDLLESDGSQACGADLTTEMHVDAPIRFLEWRLRSNAK